MKNSWTMPRTPVRASKNAETIKAYEGIIEEYRKAVKAYKQDIKTLERENAYLKSTLEVAEEEPFPPAEKQRAIAEKKRDKDLGAVRSELAHKIREKITQKTLEGCFSVTIYASELVRFDDELLKTYNHDEIMEPIVKALREEGYQAGQSTTAFGGFLDGSYFVSWN